MTIKRIIYSILLILTFALIFYFSSEDSIRSGNTSSRTMNFIADVFNVEENREAFIEKGIPYLRKIAHFLVFMLAGFWEILLLNTFEGSDLKKIVLSALIGLTYAIIDEFHQSFTPGRAPMLIDVIIDFEGNLIGILFILQFIVQKRKRTK
jgi:VanZ family protein